MKSTASKVVSPNICGTGILKCCKRFFKDIVLRDIAVRHGVKNTQTLMDISLFLISNIAKPHTFNSLRKSFSVGSPSTVSDYLAWLEDSYPPFFPAKIQLVGQKDGRESPQSLYD